MRSGTSLKAGTSGPNLSRSRPSSSTSKGLLPEPEIFLDSVMAGIFGARQQGPPERPDAAFNVAEATEEEVQAAANRKAEREEESALARGDC